MPDPPTGTHASETVPTYCALCVSRCGAKAVVEDGELRALHPDPSHPTGQALYIKGKVAPELVYHRERSLHPLRRTRPKDTDDPGWKRIRRFTPIRWFDDSREWARQGAKSCAHWLGWRIGVDAGAARERVRVARALAELPAVDDALRRGRLSYSKVRAVTRVATPGNEAMLVDYARRTTAAQLERIFRTTRKIARRDAKGPGRPPNLERFVRCRQVAAGMVRIEMQLEADEAMLVWEAIQKEGLEGARDELPREEKWAKREDKATSFTSRGPEDEALAAEVASAPADSTPQSPDGDRDVSAESEETLRRVACDAALVAVMKDEQGKTLDVGRARRTVPAALRRALLVRDRGCAFPGCPHTRWLHAHHIEHWLYGGETKKENLCLLCSFHHRLVHEEGWHVRLGKGGLARFVSPEGTELANVPRRPLTFGDPQFALVQLLRQAEWSSDIDDDSNRCLWDGHRVHHEYCALAALARA